jgi:hypothetical protein
VEHGAKIKQFRVVLQPAALSGERAPEEDAAVSLITGLSAVGRLKTGVWMQAPKEGGEETMPSTTDSKSPTDGGKTSV